MKVLALRALTLVVAALATSLWHTAAAHASAPPNRDLNGDGLADVVVELYDPRADHFDSWVVYGKRDAVAVQRATIGAGGARVAADCTAVTAAGDVDADGVGELAMACTRSVDSASEVTVVAPRAAAGTLDPFQPALPALRIGGADLRQVAPLGDVNGDGRADLIVTASYRRHHQTAYVVFGRPLPASVDVRSLGSGGVVVRGPRHRSRYYGGALGAAGAGDVDGDGAADVLIGDPQYPDRSCGFDGCKGRAWLLFGGSRLAGRISLPRLGRRGFMIRPGAGKKLMGVGADGGPAGDLDGDGHDDLLVGASVRFDQSAFVLWGGPRRTRPRVLTRRSSRLRAARGGGAYATPIGDVDGDGRDDLTVNDPALGPSLNVLFGHRWRGAVPVARARPPGIQALVAPAEGVLTTQGLDDVNGDQVPDLFVREAQPSEESYEERAFVVFGRRPLRRVKLAALGQAGFEIR